MSASRQFSRHWISSFHEGRGAVGIDKDDINKVAAERGESEFVISCCFSDLPSTIVLDASYETTFADEYLLNGQGCLEIEKHFTTKLSKVYLNAYHPAREECVDLLVLKNKDLKKRIERLNIECGDQTVNAIMRNAIREHFSSILDLQLQKLDVQKGDDLKSIWSNVQNVLPVYSLFQSDRENNDTDSEVQDPLKESAKQIIGEPQLQAKLAEVATAVIAALSDVASRTYAKLHEMAPHVAAGLTPRVPSSNELKWADVFKTVSITGTDNIPINKRGSGVKRLILLNFFRAQAEQSQGNGRGIIYAIEEPETSQHYEHQRLIIAALNTLASHANTQVLVTTHSPVIVKGLGMENLRHVYLEGARHTVGSVEGNVLSWISLNEVSYLAFGEASEEYHDELWGVIAGDGSRLNAFRANKPLRSYLRSDRQEADGSPRREQRVLSHYIRDVMHHPENTLNSRYTVDELKQSIDEMRAFIAAQN